MRADVSLSSFSNDAVDAGERDRSVMSQRSRPPRSRSGSRWHRGYLLLDRNNQVRSWVLDDSSESSPDSGSSRKGKGKDKSQDHGDIHSKGKRPGGWNLFLGSVKGKGKDTGKDTDKGGCTRPGGWNLFLGSVKGKGKDAGKDTDKGGGKDKGSSSGWNVILGKGKGKDMDKGKDEGLEDMDTGAALDTEEEAAFKAVRRVVKRSRGL